MKRIHCVGIGGIGISAIARLLSERGVRVSGSDLHISPVAQSLAELGVTIFHGHDSAQVGDVDALLISSAIPAHNVEVVEARRRGIPVYKRAEFLGRLMAGHAGIAIAGTHGKTTTTSMLIWVLVQAGLDPTFIVGGVIQQLGVNAHAGRGAHFVIEADEYDHMFLGLAPTVAAVTHLEHDHPDCFPTFADMRTAFERFLNLVPADGLVVGCGDHPAVEALLQQFARLQRCDTLTCGLGTENDWQAQDVHPNARGGHDFRVMWRGRVWGDVSLSIAGMHNVQNALIVIAIAEWLGVDRQRVRRGLAEFAGARRRFEIRGEGNGIVVIDDYGHHPTEIAVTLAGARARYPDRPIWAVFQPHTYSRTKTLWRAFLACFEQADHVIVLDIYAAREKDKLGIDAAALAAEMAARGHRDVRHIADFDRAAEHIVRYAEPNAVVITLSAGDGNLVGEKVLDKIGKQSGEPTDNYEQTTHRRTRN